MESNTDTMRCARCGDVIGVYEPAVIVTGDMAHTTSLAARRDLPFELEQVYHRDCALDLLSS